MKAYEIEPTPGERDSGIVTPSDHVCVLDLTAATAKSCTVPTGAKSVKIKCMVEATGAEAGCWVSLTGTATVPSADVTDGSAAIPNPDHLVLQGVTSISVISPVACLAHLMFYA